MTLPNYFLADLPTEATLTGPMITEACQTLKRNREHYLSERPTSSLIRTIVLIAANWLDPEFPIRTLALKDGPRETGFRAATISAGLDGFFKQLTTDNLTALIEQDLGHASRLDQFSGSEEEILNRRLSRAHGPEFLVHILGGCLPNPAMSNMILGLLLRSAQFVKCNSGNVFFARLFAHSIYQAEPKLGACLEVARWTGGADAIENPLFAETDCVTAMGSDRTIATLRDSLPRHVRFVGYGHRISFGYVAKESLVGGGKRSVARSVAADVAAWNQLGCLSPHVIYVERDAELPPAEFAQRVADELAALEEKEPRGEISTKDAATIASRRSFYEVRAANVPDTLLWSSDDSTAWTVVYEESPLFQVSCLNRFIYVKGVENLGEALAGADKIRGKVSTVGIAAPSTRAKELATELAAWGAPRVCPLGRMQNPPLNWRHDGRPSLGELVGWTDLEL